MIIDVPYKQNDVISLKLASGEEIVGKLLEEKADLLIISKPLSLTATKEGMGLAPFMFTADLEKKFYFKPYNIICITKTQEDMAKNYIQSTTGIQI